MNDKLSSKILAPDLVAKIISEFNVADYVNRDKSEIQTVIAMLTKEQDRLEGEIDTFSSTSDDIRKLNELLSLVKTITSILKTLLPVLSSRVSDDDITDKTLVQLTKDDVVEVTENGESRYETTEVVDSSVIFANEIKYHFANVDEYNNAKGTEKDDENYFYDLLCRFRELSLLDCFKYAGKRLSDFPDAVASDIIDCNYEWHSLYAIGADNVRLNASLKIYPEKRELLLSEGFIVKEHIAKAPKVATAVQMSLFGDDAEEINILGDN